MDLKSKGVAQRIQDALLRKDHGIWYRQIQDVFDNKGRYLNTEFVGNPILTPGFRKLYSLSPKHEGGIISLVERKDCRVVTNAIRRAMHPDRRAVTCTVQMKGLKVIEVYCRRLKLTEKLEVFVSLHTNLSAASEWQGIQKMVLDSLPGFVFAKRWCPNRRKFVYVYINRQLANAFNVKNEHEVEGKTDSDFIGDPDELRQLRRIERKVIKGQTITGEENLSPKQRLGCPSRTYRLATIRMPYQIENLETQPLKETLVLGIAFDISPITGLLRNIIEQSKDAIYVKDRLGRYTLTNPQFLKLLGLPPDSDILNMTFAQVVKHRMSQVGKDRVAELIAEIKTEDKSIFNNLPGLEFECVRPAWFSDATHWISTKKLIDIPGVNPPASSLRIKRRGKTLDPHKFILGVSKSLFGGINTEFLDRIPQCICVKDEHFKYVWCNQSHAERHNKSQKRLIGEDDYTIWPSDKFGREVPDQLRRRDRIVLEIGRKYLALDRDPTTEGFRLRWDEIYAELQKRNCIEYREAQPTLDGRGICMLQTTKWPEFLGGKLFVVVVYSDVTEGDKALERYHRMTVHTLRSAMLPFDSASTVLNRVVNETESKQVKKAANIISIGLDRTNWFFNCHLKLLKMKLHKGSLIAIPVLEIRKYLKDAVGDARKIANGAFAVKSSLENSASVENILAEPDFLKAVIFEILRNAHMAITERCDYEPTIAHRMKLKGISPANGNNRKSRRKIEVVLHEERKGLVISIADDGIANVLEEAKGEVVAAYKQAAAERSVSVGKFGVAFCLDVVKRLGGKVKLEFENGMTTVRLFLPYYAK